MEHKECKDCKWNNYPTCKGTIMENGLEMNIENLKEGFQCGQKKENEIMDFSQFKPKIEELEERIIALESKIEATPKP